MCAVRHTDHNHLLPFYCCLVSTSLEGRAAEDLVPEKKTRAIGFVSNSLLEIAHRFRGGANALPHRKLTSGTKRISPDKVAHMHVCASPLRGAIIEANTCSFWRFGSGGRVHNIFLLRRVLRGDNKTKGGA